MNLKNKSLLKIKNVSENKIQKEIKKYTGSKHKLLLFFDPTKDLYISFEDHAISFNVYSDDGLLTGIYASASFGEDIDKLCEKFDAMRKLYLNADDDGIQLLDKDADYFEDIGHMLETVTELNAHTSTGVLFKLVNN